MKDAFIEWLISLLEERVVTIRVAIIGTQEYYDLTRKSLTSGLSTMIRAALLFRKNKDGALDEINIFLENNYGILHYLSSMSLERIVDWLLNLKVPARKDKDRPTYAQSIQYKILRLQGLHEVIPKALRDIAEINRFVDVNVYIDRDAESSDSVYTQYINYILPKVILEAESVPDEIGSVLKGRISYNAKTRESHCERVKQVVGDVSNVCSGCTEDCPAGIWLTDIIAHMFYLCLNEQKEAVCRMIEELCEHVRSYRRKSFTIFVIPKEVRNRFSDTALANCVWDKGGYGVVR